MLQQQQVGPFEISKKIENLAYKLDLFKNWHIHNVISVTQLESCLKESDSYKWPQSDHSSAVKHKLNNEFSKYYEIETILNWQKRHYDCDFLKIKYLLQWKSYELKYDTWKREDHLDCVNLIEKYNQTNHSD